VLRLLFVTSQSYVQYGIYDNLLLILNDLFSSQVSFSSYGRVSVISMVVKFNEMYIEMRVFGNCYFNIPRHLSLALNKTISVAVATYDVSTPDLMLTGLLFLFSTFPILSR